jgi:hypothetical protein
MFRVLALVFFSLSVACSSDINENIVVFNYKDFGPQVIASEIIGMEWWQWQPHGESRPAQYDVKVVVYRNVTLERVKNIYPVISEQKQDYRYLEYDAALVYLDEKIKENVIEDVTARLKETKKLIVSKLGDIN